MAKSNSKSIRLSDEVMSYINSYRGNGFNEKFENIILDAQKEEKNRIKRLNDLDKKIKSKLEHFEIISGKVYELDGSLAVACRINSSISDLKKQFEKLLR